MRAEVSGAEALLSQVSSFFASADPATKREATSQLQKFLWSCERSEDFVWRMLAATTLAPVARLAGNVGIPQALTAENGTPKSVDQIAQHTGMDSSTLGRILRHMAAVGMVEELDQDQFQANDSTRSMLQPGVQAGIGFTNDIMQAASIGIPAYFQKTKHGTADDPADGPWQLGMRTNLTYYQYLLAHPDQFREFSTFMTEQRREAGTFFDVYDLSQSPACDPQDPFFVDIGGGIGHVCKDVQKRLSQLSGRIVLQDLEPIIQRAKTQFNDDQGVDLMVHDYFSPQPVRGSRFYYIRNCLHNLTDADCLRVLEATKPAMDNQSLLLIDDFVLPVKNVQWRATTMDINMMNVLGAQERTVARWDDLLAKAGLERVSLHYYNDVPGDTLQVVRPLRT